ncbi:hypothetical protein [Paraburkholderia sp. 31.1]|nr:hypothetical protein [Paraburkholderia sp. 31.1]
MGRFKNANGVVLNIPDEKAKRLGLVAAGDESTKPAASHRQAQKKSDN